MLQLLNQVSAQVDNALTRAFANQYLGTALTMFLVLYAGLAAPNLPPLFAALFDNPLFKLLILFLVLVVRNYDPTVALMTAVGFTVSMQALNRYKMFGLVSDLGNLMQSSLGLGGQGEGEAAGNGEGEKEDESDSESEDDAPEGVASDLSEMGAPVLGGCVANAVGGGGYGEGESMVAGEASEESLGFDKFGFLGCQKPQPQGVDMVLPPQPDVPEQVAAVMNPGCQYQGPQGMQHPVGFSGIETGASYGDCQSEI